MRNNIILTEAQLAYLKANWGKKNQREIAQNLGIHKSSVTNVATRYGFPPISVSEYKNISFYGTTHPTERQKREYKITQKEIRAKVRIQSGKAPKIAVKKTITPSKVKLPKEAPPMRIPAPKDPNLYEWVQIDARTRVQRLKSKIQNNDN